MPKLVRSAYLEACARCGGRHAHIRLPDGEHSGEFIDKTRARGIIEALRLAPLITEKEAMALEDQVGRSQLLENNLGAVVELIIELHYAHCADALGRAFLEMLGALEPIDGEEDDFEDAEPLEEICIPPHTIQ